MTLSYNMQFHDLMIETIHIPPGFFYQLKETPGWHERKGLKAWVYRLFYKVKPTPHWQRKGFYWVSYPRTKESLLAEIINGAAHKIEEAWGQVNHKTKCVICKKQDVDRQRIYPIIPEMKVTAIDDPTPPAAFSYDTFTVDLQWYMMDMRIQGDFGETVIVRLGCTYDPIEDKLYIDIDAL